MNLKIFKLYDVVFVVIKFNYENVRIMNFYYKITKKNILKAS